MGLGCWAQVDRPEVKATGGKLGDTYRMLFSQNNKNKYHHGVLDSWIRNPNQLYIGNNIFWIKIHV
jgi:hypothetical protein